MCGINSHTVLCPCLCVVSRVCLVLAHQMPRHFLHAREFTFGLSCGQCPEHCLYDQTAAEYLLFFLAVVTYEYGDPESLFFMALEVKSKRNEYNKEREDSVPILPTPVHVSISVQSTHLCRTKFQVTFPS